MPACASRDRTTSQDCAVEGCAAERDRRAACNRTGPRRRRPETSRAPSASALGSRPTAAHRTAESTGAPRAPRPRAGGACGPRGRTSQPLADARAAPRSRAPSAGQHRHRERDRRARPARGSSTRRTCPRRTMVACPITAPKSAASTSRRFSRFRNVSADRRARQRSAPPASAGTRGSRAGAAGSTARCRGRSTDTRKGTRQPQAENVLRRHRRARRRRSR